MTNTVIGGVFIVVPVYLAILLLLKGMQSAVRLVRPFAALLPDWLPAEGVFSLLLVLLVCFVVGAGVRTRGGRALRECLEKVFFERLPGYSLLRSLTQRLAGDSEENAWQQVVALYARRLTRTRQARRCNCRGRRAARPDRSARQRPATWGRTVNGGEHEGSAR